MSETNSFPLPTTEIHVWVVYLTARCNFACDYCIQKPQMIPGQRRKPWGRYRELSGRQWVEALNAFPVRPEHPLVLTGGEPTLHRDFAFLASRLEGYDLDMTSNLTFDVDALAREMRAHGKAFKTSFHTYHPKFLSPEKWLDQAERLRDSGLVEAPVFSMVNLDRFPHFRDEEHERNLRTLIDLADRRGLAYQFNEFRGTHMGKAFNREHRYRVDCTSAWVDFDPEGNIHNCHYHLTERKNAFGNIRKIADCRPLPGMGEFFACNDFGYCDPCHENSGHGAFRDEDGRVFTRTDDDPRIYLESMEPDAIRAVARRYVAQRNLAEAEHALFAAIAKARDAGRDDPQAWSELGLVLCDRGKERHGLSALIHAVEAGWTHGDTVAAAMILAQALGLEEETHARIRDRIPAADLREIEAAVAATPYRSHVERSSS